MHRSIIALLALRAPRATIKRPPRRALATDTNASERDVAALAAERHGAPVAEADANAESVLAAMDRCAETSWMMNMGQREGHTHRKSHCTEEAETPAGDRHLSRLHVHPFGKEHARRRIINNN